MKVKYFILFIFFTKGFAVPPVIPVIDVRKAQEDLIKRFEEKISFAEFSLRLKGFYEKLETIQNVYEQVETLAKIEEECEKIINETKDMSLEKKEKIKELLDSTQENLVKNFSKILHSKSSFKDKVKNFKEMLSLLKGNVNDAGLALQEAALETNTEIQKSLTELQLLQATIYKKNEMEKKINEKNNTATFKGMEKIGL